MLHNNLWATIITFLLALAWLRINDLAAQQGLISSTLSRKIIHIGTGPIFVLAWLFFDNAAIAPWLAALIPFAITVQFILVGTGLIKDEAAVQAMSRSGNRREILRGPLYYGIVFIILTLGYWKRSPIGVIALMMMCGGDGLAGITGQRWGKYKLPWNRMKSWVGSLGMLVGGWLLSVVVFGIYLKSGIFSGSFLDTLPAITWIALICTGIETLPLRDIDNLTVTATAVLFGHILL